MRALLIVLSLTSATAGLTACTTDPNSPAIKAMEPVNTCGPGGTQDINQCSGGR